jgi:peptidoglycan/LPS O-acetylase OafA/YrhL
MRQTGVSRGFSVYLDAVRFSAALWVVLAHFQAWGFAPAGMAAWLPSNGRDAVVLFFVLSGFVIAHSAGSKTARTYAVDRLARIYSVAMPIVLLSTGAALLAVALGYHTPSSIYSLEKLWVYLPLYFSFLGDAWYLKEVPYGIIPYWSLNYEFWYYALFGILLYLRGPQRWLALAAVLIVIGYKLWLLWPLWLAGAWLHTNRDRWAISQGLARGLMVASVAGYFVMETTHFDVLLWETGNAWVSN